MRLLAILGVALTLFSTAAQGSPPAQSAYRVIVRSTDLAPVDGPPVRYGDFDYGLGGAILTERGDVWFSAGFHNLAGNTLFPDCGIFLHRDGQSQLILRQNMPLPAPRENEPLLLIDPNDMGDYLTSWHANSTTLYYTPPVQYPYEPFGVWSAGPNSPPSVQPIEDLLPIELNNVQYAAATRYDDSGPVVVSMTYDDGYPNWSLAIYTRGLDGHFSLAARELGRAPGTPDGWLFDLSRLNLSDAARNGAVLVQGSVIEGIEEINRSPIEPGYTDGLWKRLPGGELELAALTGTIAPGGEERFYGIGGGHINARGEIAFGATTEGGIDPTDGERGIWTDAGGRGLRKVLSEGDPAPGLPDGFVFSRYSSRPAISESGKVAVQIGAELGSQWRSGIWEESTSGLQLVASSGDQAPGAQPGKTFEHLWLHSMNGTGQIVFSATIDEGNPAAQSNEVGIWAQDRHGELQLIVKSGDLLEVAPGVFSEVSAVSFSWHFNEDQVINDRGEILFHARFTDGTQALFVSNVVAIPEPSSCVLAFGFAMLGFGASRKRNRRLDRALAQ